MTREQVLVVLGALVLLAPWSGLPLAWLEWILPVVGLLVVGIGYTLWKRNRTISEPELHQIQEEPRPRSSRIAIS